MEVPMVQQSADGEQHAIAPMLFGLRVVMLGRQGSGKGTQGVQLAKLLVVPHVSVGDVLRDAVGSGSPTGRRAQETMERGELVDDDLVVSLVAERLAAPDVRSGGFFVLDGFPRTADQAAALEDILADGTPDREGAGRQDHLRSSGRPPLGPGQGPQRYAGPSAQRNTPFLRCLQGTRAR
jgi:Adenylate kinase